MHIALKFIQTTIAVLILNHAHASIKHDTTYEKLHAIEHEYHLKIGVYALDTNSNQVISYHENDRFPFQSTFKLIGVSTLLAQDNQKRLLEKKVFIHPKDIVFWHPVSGKYVNQYVSLRTLAEAAISYSDNTAINVILHELGGVKSVNKFARKIGNHSFILEHYESKLNSNPHLNADTSTPKDMGLSVQKILLETVLNNQNKTQLLEWMRNNTTGYHRIRAGVPLGWAVADKTGSGSYGIANDVGIAWSSSCQPVAISIFTISDERNVKPNDQAIAKITRVLFEEFEQHHDCYKATHLN